MTHGSLFAGIGGFDLGFEQAGWKTVWQVEIEPFCQKVLEKRFPAARRFTDIRECGARNLERVDCITAGVPCQDVSVAGKRRGLAGKRTGLFYHFARILCELRPAWFVFENVPGLFSSNQGRDFAEVLRVLMVRCGYGVSWRVLDSQFFGVAQRRKRVYIVGSLRKPCPPEILFEPARGRRDSAPGGEARESVAYAIAAGSGGSKFGSGRQGQDTFVAGSINSHSRRHGHAMGTQQAAESAQLVAARIKPSPYSDHGDERHNLVVAAPIVIQDVRGMRDKPQNGIGIDPGGPSYTLDKTSQHAVAFSTPPDSDRMRDPTGISEGLDDPGFLPTGLDSARYRALGNAVTVQVAEWIARRILNVAP